MFWNAVKRNTVQSFKITLEYSQKYENIVYCLPSLYYTMTEKSAKTRATYSNNPELC